MNYKKINDLNKKTKDWVEIPMEKINESLKPIEEDQGIKFTYTAKQGWKFLMEHLINDYDNTVKKLMELEEMIIKEEYKKLQAEKQRDKII